MTIEGNLLEGLGWQLGLEENTSGYDNMRAMNNRFSGTGFGTTYRTGGPGWAQWQENYVYSASAVDGKGRIVYAP